MADRFVVTAAYVTIETAVAGGRAQVDIAHGTELPADVPAEQVATLLATGRIALVVEPPPVVEEPPPPPPPPAKKTAAKAATK